MAAFEFHFQHQKFQDHTRLMSVLFVSNVQEYLSRILYAFSLLKLEILDDLEQKKP